MVSQDERIRQQVLRAAMELGVVTVSCAVEDGDVILEGVVSSDELAYELEAAARAVPGARYVVNNLMIEGFSATVDNVVEGVDLTPDFTAEVGTGDAMTAASEAEPYFPPTDPIVRPEHSFEELDIVGGFAETSDEGMPMAGISGESRGDEEIRHAVLTALRLDAATTDIPIEVEVEDGVVILRGTVLSLEDADLVETVAAQVPGVEEVREELRVVGM